jgi:hypothetical protein
VHERVRQHFYIINILYISKDRTKPSFQTRVTQTFASDLFWQPAGKNSKRLCGSGVIKLEWTWQEVKTATLEIIEAKIE